MTAAGSKALGNQRFRLQNIEFLGEDFEPESKVGFKMQTKGYLIPTAQPGTHRHYGDGVDRVRAVGSRRQRIPQ